MYLQNLILEATIPKLVCGHVFYMKSLHMVTFILLIVGGLAWGLHAFGYDPIDSLGSSVSMIVYVLVGLSAIYEAISHKGLCRNCSSSSM